MMYIYIYIYVYLYVYMNRHTACYQTYLHTHTYKQHQCFDRALHDRNPQGQYSRTVTTKSLIQNWHHK